MPKSPLAETSGAGCAGAYGPLPPRSERFTGSSHRVSRLFVVDSACRELDLWHGLTVRIDVHDHPYHDRTPEDVQSLRVVT